MILVIGSIICGGLFVLLGVVFFLKRRHQRIIQRYGLEVNQLNQALREAEQHQDTLTHQLQQRDQKIEHYIETLQELTMENSTKQAELHMLREVQDDLQKKQLQVENLLSENAYMRASLESEQAQTKEKLALLEQAEERLQLHFKNLSSDIFQQNQKNFMTMADATLKATLDKSRVEMAASLGQKEVAIQTLVKPIQEALGLVDTKIQHLEKERLSAYETLKVQVGQLIHTQKELRTETANLVRALRAPQVRGKWGEMQLRRVVEMAGMTAHCDFVEQSSTTNDDGKTLRPDMVIHLPGGHQIIVDAKAPLSAYLDALEMPDDHGRQQKLMDHARHVRTHIKALSQRSYTDQFEKSPDFVVLFLPGEMFFSAALEQDPELLELGFKDKVILSTPTTLIALLRAVAYGWRQEALNDNARAISKLGQELSKRISDVASHMMRLGKSIGHVVDHYNQTVGTLERRVLVSARKFKALDSHADAIEDLSPVLHIPRELQALEFAPNLGNTDEMSCAPPAISIADSLTVLDEKAA